MKGKTSPLRPFSESLSFLSSYSRRNLNGSPEQEFFPADATPFEERELLDVCTFAANERIVEIGRAVDSSKPFASFGSYPRRHGDESPGRCSGCGSGLSAEASAKFECCRTKRFSVRERTTFLPSATETSECTKAAHREAPAELEWRATKRESMKQRTSSPSLAVEAAERAEAKVHCRLGKQRSFPSDIDREEAWERKRELYGMDELWNERSNRNGGCARARSVARSISDCGGRTWPADKGYVKTRTRSLTDEDLEELRGCIDLGFGFSSGEDCDLSGTLPALELYYAINRQFNESKSRSSPVSPLEGGMLYRTSSEDSPGSPLSDSWRISSPGDNPSQVKTRLRHWAQAVACSVKQGCSL